MSLSGSFLPYPQSSYVHNPLPSPLTYLALSNMHPNINKFRSLMLIRQNARVSTL